MATAKKTSKIPPPAPPLREADHVSKRGVHYWFSPEWVRGTNSSNTTHGRIKAVRSAHYQGQADLYMQSKEGNLTYIQGSIQAEFRQWHEQRKIDYFFLADDPEELEEFILAADDPQ